MMESSGSEQHQPARYQNQSDLQPILTQPVRTTLTVSALKVAAISSAIALPLVLVSQARANAMGDQPGTDDTSSDPGDAGDSADCVDCTDAGDADADLVDAYSLDGVADHFDHTDTSTDPGPDTGTDTGGGGDCGGCGSCGGCGGCGCDYGYEDE